MKDFPWVDCYPVGVYWDAALPQTSTCTLLADAVRQWPDRPAIDFMDRKLSYRQLAQWVDRAAAGFQQLGVRPGFHVGLYLPNTPQYVISFFAVLKAGGTVVNYSPLDAEAVLAHKIDDSDTDLLVTLNLPGLYTTIRPLLGNSRLKWLVVGTMGDFAADTDGVNRRLQESGAPPPLELLKRLHQLTGCLLTEGWGMTETTSMGTFTPGVGLRKVGACGMPVPGVMLRLLDLDDPERDAAPGTPGEIAIRGPNVMQGYWKNAPATAESFTRDGYFKTGDVATMDEDGFVFIVDRTKDMLLCAGFNVYPRVIEEAIYAHPQVEEVMVIGIDDSYRGQSPKAFIKLRSDAATLTLDALRHFLKPRLGKHEMIHAMELRSELPKTAVGKLSKKMLRDEIALHHPTATLKAMP